MKIALAKSAGFCFGVKRALAIAYNTAKIHKNVFMLGDIVHNEDVIRDIQKKGIKKIEKLTQGINKIFLVRAHGNSQGQIAKAKRLGYKIIDATCPMVKEIHKIAGEMEQKGFQVIIIGDKKHDEVRGIIGQLKKNAVIIDPALDFPLNKIRGLKKAAVLSQSTQELEKVLGTVRKLQKYIPHLEFFNTICKPTRIKQEEIKILPVKNDVIIVIGSKTSANTKRLYEISKSLNKRTYWVESKKDLKASWFRGAKNVGVTSGASTPDATTKDVIKHIKLKTSPSGL